MLKKSAFQKDSMPQFLFNLVYGLVCTSPIFSGEYAGILMGLAYLQFLMIAKHRPIDRVVRICQIGFLLSLLATLALLIVHWDVIQAGEGFPAETLKNVAWFGLAFMVIDAVRFQVTYYKINLVSFAKFLLIFAICIVPAKLIYFSILFDIPIAEYFQFQNNREIAFLDLNPNYADDVLIAHIVVISWTIAVLRGQLLQEKLLAFAALLTIAFLIFHFIGANSRAAFLGVSCSFAVLLCLSFRHLSKKVALSIFALLVVIGILAAERLSDRIAQTAGQIEFVLQSGNTDNTNAKELAQISALKEVIYDIYANTPEDQSISAAIARECSPRLIDMSGTPQNKNLPPAYRYYIYQDAIKIWRLHPYLGHGAYDKKSILAKTETINPCRTAYFTGVHSQYLDIAVRGGMLSLIAFVILSLILFYLLMLSHRNKTINWLMPLPILGYFPYLYVQNIVDVSFHKKAELTAILFTMAILLAINLKKQNSNT